MKNYKKIIILAILFVAVAGMTINTASAATKTITIQNKDWKCFWNSVDDTPMDKYAEKKSGKYEIRIIAEYQDSDKRWATTYMPTKYFKSLVLRTESKKKFKSATYYLYDDKTGKYKKKITLKAKHEYLLPGEKGYRAYKLYNIDHRTICKKVVINY